MTILISGGHLTPALAFIDYIQTKHPEVNIVFVGRKYTREKEKQISREKEEVSARSIKFIELSAAKLSASNPFAIIQIAIRFISSIFHTLTIIKNAKPNVFVSFGGYIAVPIAIASWIHRVPLITHEQTRSVGISNQLIGRLANKVAVSHPESQQYFPKHKVTVTGNLIRKQLLKKSAPKPSWYSTDSTLPLLYITGGSQGSEVINATVSQSLTRILRDWIVIHQCGAASQTRSYLRELERRKSQLNRAQKNRYFIKEWITEQELAWIYKHAKAAISRAGANTTQELTYYKLPAVLIPLPFSHFQEQQKNAEALAQTGGTFIIAQKNLSPDSLLETLEILRTKNQACRRKLAELVAPADADKKLYDLVTTISSTAHEKENTQ